MPKTDYFTADGTRVPGVTTIIGVLSKDQLIHWAWKCGMDGKDYRNVRDEKGSIGTLCHHIIEAYLKGEHADYAGFPSAVVDKAENAALAYFEWEQQHTVEPIIVEPHLVSELGFGGTPDCLAKVDGAVTLLDFKTSAGIYENYYIQLAAYDHLLRDYGYAPEAHTILRIGREEDEGFEVQQVGNLDSYWQIFTHCLGIYQTRRLLNGNNRNSRVRRK